MDAEATPIGRKIGVSPVDEGIVTCVGQKELSAAWCVLGSSRTGLGSNLSCRTQMRVYRVTAPARGYLLTLLLHRMGCALVVDQALPSMSAALAPLTPETAH